ncbi:hypothetical protein CMI37_20170 [Candidatus Pacearchaeota archaeon]|nr:hypothetical protein [Candidatus Pacearchaeota archaeon]|tara:strand:- start:286 stop:717 length:432 start_codon:yes stop_codon:yes gene_type:complete
MNKLAAEKIASEYYEAGIQLAMRKIALDLGQVQEAMDAQRDLYQGEPADRIGSLMEQRRREGALLGTAGGAGLGALLGGAAGSKGGKALAALGALLGAGTGGVLGNLGGRASGLASGGVEGALSSIPGVMGTADYLSQPLRDY